MNSFVIAACCLLQRGAHTFFLKMGKVGRWAGYTVNLIHYEDAAELAAAVRLTSKFIHFVSYSIFDPSSTLHPNSPLHSPLKFITVKAPSLNRDPGFPKLQAKVGEEYCRGCNAHPHLPLLVLSMS